MNKKNKQNRIDKITYQKGDFSHLKDLPRGIEQPESGQCDCYCHYTVQVLTTPKAAGLRKNCSHCSPSQDKDSGELPESYICEKHSRILIGKDHCVNCEISTNLVKNTNKVVDKEEGIEWKKRLEKNDFTWILNDILSMPDTFYRAEQLRKLILQVREQARREVAKEICKIIDYLELDNHGSSLEEWKEYKHIRNTIRDKYLSSEKGGKK